MPIHRKRYPDNWVDIAKAIKEEAQWTCEKCHRPCRRPNESIEQMIQRLAGSIWVCEPHNTKESKYQRFVLTVIHLDQNPSNSKRNNLKAFCTVCHLRLSSQFKATQRKLLAEYNGQLIIKWREGCGTQLSLLPKHVQPYSIPKTGICPIEGKAIIVP